MTVAAVKVSSAEGKKMKLAWKSCGIFWRTPRNDLFFLITCVLCFTSIAESRLFSVTVSYEIDPFKTNEIKHK